MSRWVYGLGPMGWRTYCLACINTPFTPRNCLGAKDENLILVYERQYHRPNLLGIFQKWK